MKKITILLGCLCSTLLLGACGEKDMTHGTKPSPQPEAEVLGKGTDYELRCVDKTELAGGVNYRKYELKDTKKVYVAEADLTQAQVTLDSFFADDVCPNPYFENSNNGKKLRETLSEICIRKRSEGHNILVGVNGEYYESQCGILLSFHVDNGEVVFIPDPYTVSVHKTFDHGFVLFKDGTTSTEARTVDCKARWSDIEVPIYSVNDTIVRLSTNARSGAVPYQSCNLYNYRYRKIPFASEPTLVNPIGTKALFIVCKSEGELQNNIGWIDASITSVTDGRNGSLSEAPYVSGKDEYVLQLTGTTADKYASAKVGDPISVRFDISVGGQAKPIKTHIGGIFRLVHNGEYVEVPSSRQTEKKRATIVGTDESGKIVKIICIDTDKFLYKDHAEVCKLLGVKEAIKVDGGGSTEMWTWDKRKGIIQCPSTDSRGPERSNMNYLTICKE